MTTKPSWRCAAILALAGSTAGCVTAPSPVPIALSLPPAALIVPDPAPRPAVRVGDDARVLALQALAYGEANARRLKQARESYEALAAEYAVPPNYPFSPR